MAFLKKYKKSAIVAGLIIAAVLAYQIWFKDAVVAAYKVEKRDFIPSLVISGEIIPDARVALSSQTMGIVAECLVNKGDIVQKGQTLVRLDDQQARVDFERAEKQVELARLNLQQASLVTREQVRVASVQADLELEQSQKDYERSRLLWQAGALSQQQLEAAEKKLESAQQTADSAKVTMEAYMNDGVNIGILQAELEQRQIDLAERQLVLEQYIIKAPFEGQVLDLYVSVGELVQTGTSIVLVSSSHYSRVRIKPDQRYAGLAVVGNRAEVWISSQANEKWEAKVDFAEPTGDADQGTITVELRLESAVTDFYPGQLVSVQLYGETSTQAIIIPDAFLTSQQGTNGAWVARSARAHFMELQVGMQTKDGVLILAGLQEGDVLLAPAGMVEGRRVFPRIEGDK